jgi:hypothetical protein
MSQGNVSRKHYADISCDKQLNYTNIKTGNICQPDLNDVLPFQTLSNDDFLSSINENSLSDRDMDRLNLLKFNPFNLNSNIALCDNNADLDNVLDVSKITCEYFLPANLKKQANSIKLDHEHLFSVICLNIRSIANKFDMFKQLINSTEENFQVIGLTETWFNDGNCQNFNLNGYDFISQNRHGKKGAGVGLYVAEKLQY